MLRLATTADLPLILKWRNDPTTRFYRNDSRMIEADEHADWFARRQASANKVFLFGARMTAFSDLEPVGQIVLDIEEDGTEIGWIVAPEHRGKGIGRQMVRAFLSEYSPNRAWCKMRDDNLASYYLALSCGFHPVAKDGRMQIMNLQPQASGQDASTISSGSIGSR